MGVTALAIGAVVAGTAASAYGASQAGDTAGARNVNSEVGGLPFGTYEDQLQSLMAQQQGSNLWESNADLSLYPQYQAAAQTGQVNTAQAALGLYPSAYSNEVRASRDVAQGNVRTMNQYGGQYASALGQASPGYAALNGVISGAQQGQSPLLQQMNWQAANAGPSALNQQASATALQQLQLGSGLSAEQTRDANQTAQAAYADRGIDMSTPAVAAQILGRDEYGQQLLQQRQTNAANVWGLQTGAQQMANQYQQGVQSLNQSDASSRANTLMGAESAQMSPLQQWIGTRTDVSPFAATQAMSLAPGVGTPAQIMSMSPQVQGAAGAASNLYNYGNDVYNTNFNAQQAALINQANAYTSMGSGLTSAAGGIYGGYLKGGGSSGSTSTAPNASWNPSYNSMS